MLAMLKRKPDIAVLRDFLNLKITYKGYPARFTQFYWQTHNRGLMAQFSGIPCTLETGSV